MHALQQGFGDLNIKEEFIGSMPIMKIFEQMSSNTELLDDLHRMRDVETDVRNVAAHEIVSVTDDWIFRKTKMHAEDIMEAAEAAGYLRRRKGKKRVLEFLFGYEPSNSRKLVI